MNGIQKAALNFALDSIFNVDETGLFNKVLPRRTYLSDFEGRRTARGCTDMEHKDRVSIFVCANATGSAKVPMPIIGKSEKPRYFKTQESPIAYFAQKKAWSDSRVFRRWWDEVFLPVVRDHTTEKVLLKMDGCSSHVELKDPKEQQVEVVIFPPNCTSVHQPCNQATIVSTKRHYRGRVLDFKADQLYEAAGLRDKARRKRMKADRAGPAQGHHPHMRDVCELLRDALSDVTQDSIAR